MKRNFLKIVIVASIFLILAVGMTGCTNPATPTPKPVLPTEQPLTSGNVAATTAPDANAPAVALVNNFIRAEGFTVSKNLTNDKTVLLNHQSYRGDGKKDDAVYSFVALKCNDSTDAENTYQASIKMFADKGQTWGEPVSDTHWSGTITKPGAPVCRITHLEVYKTPNNWVVWIEEA
jgi:hypothetical protein